MGRNPVTYQGMLWLLAAQVVVMLPFALHLPLWLLPVLGFSAAWRLRVLAGKAIQPGQPVKLVALGLGVAGLLLGGLRFPSLDAMASLLLLGFAFKALEVVTRRDAVVVVTRRDAVVVVFVGYFLVALHFLYDQSLLAALYATFALVVLTGALLAVQQQVAGLSRGQQVRFNLRWALVLLVQALPLLVVLFVFAPRLSPLWSMPLPSAQAQTGMTERMRPGDIEKLVQSDELVFRVTFAGKVPPPQERYWRGLALNHFDGVEWRQFAEDYSTGQVAALLQGQWRWQDSKVHVQGEAVAYEAIYEPSGQPWLFTLTPPYEVVGDVLRGADYRVMARQPLHAPLLLRAVAYPQAVLDAELDSTMRRLAVALPPEGDPRSRALAQRLWQETGEPSAYIARILQRFQELGFGYTLNPPPLGERDTIDAFLFDTQQGFCAHYAGSMVFLLRAVGIPARVVVGYQGGEWNPAGNYLAVRQRDAHAWVEAWLAGQGWVRFDPTTVVAPNRIGQGVEAAVLAHELPEAGLLPRQWGWWRNVQQQFAAIQYGWQRWVLGYDRDAQMALLRHWLGEVSLLQVAWVVGGLLLLVGLAWLLLLGMLRRHDPLSPEQRLYRQFCRALAKHGVERSPSEPPGAFAARAAQQLPQLAEIILGFNQTYEAHCYAGNGGAAALRHLRTLLRRLH